VNLSLRFVSLLALTFSWSNLSYAQSSAPALPGGPTKEGVKATGTATPPKATVKAAPNVAPKAKPKPTAAPAKATLSVAQWNSPTPTNVAPKSATPPTPAKEVASAQSTVEPAFPSEDWRTLNPENALIYETTKGRIIVELAPEMAPLHVERVKKLAREGFYNGLSFHRVLGDFMAQGGDPKGDGTGGSDQPDLRAEFSFRRGADSGFAKAVDRGGASIGWIGTIPVTTQSDALMERTVDKKVAAWANHCFGIASMARGNDENSANSQFFLMRAAYPTLDRRYTIWGRAVVGVDVIRAFKVGEPVIDPDKMLSVRVLSDVEESERPKVVIQRTDGPLFQSKLKASLEQRGAAFSNCDIMPEGRILR
jgi:peptidylprolyl isomerase